MVHLTRAYRGIDDRTIPIPFISYRGKNFFFQGPTAGAQLTFYRFLTLGLQGRFRFGGYKPEDSTFLSGMDERKDTVELGGLIKIRLPIRMMIGLDVFKDIGGRHQGQNWKISVRRPFRQKNWRFIPSVGVNFLSRNNVDYYFGVEPHEARADRPAYEVPSSQNWEAAITTLYQFSERWFSMVSFSLRRLDSDIERSPIVTEKITFRTLAGLTYKF